MNSFSDLDWKYKNPHTYKIRVSEDDIDILGHTNNKVYLTWCEKVSWDHSSSLGVRPEDYKKLNCACVVISSENNFLGSHAITLVFFPSLKFFPKKGLTNPEKLLPPPVHPTKMSG